MEKMIAKVQLKYSKEIMQNINDAYLDSTVQCVYKKQSI